MTGTDSYLQSLLVTNPLQEPVMRRVVRALNLPPGSRGLDVGCGIGLQAIMLAEAVGPAGHVTGVDLSPEFLVHARDIAEKAGISEQVSFQEGDMNNLPFDDDAFDWVWSANSSRIRARRSPAATKGACTGGKARRKCCHHRMVIPTTAPGLSRAGGTSECDILRDRSF